MSAGDEPLTYNYVYGGINVQTWAASNPLFTSLFGVGVQVANGLVFDAYGAYSCAQFTWETYLDPEDIVKVVDDVLNHTNSSVVQIIDTILDWVRARAIHP